MRVDLDTGELLEPEPYLDDCGGPLIAHDVVELRGYMLAILGRTDDVEVCEQLEEGSHAGYDHFAPHQSDCRAVWRLAAIPPAVYSEPHD